MFTILTTALADTTLSAMPAQPSSTGGNIYVVMTVTLLIWGGVFFYLFYLDKKLNRVKRKMEHSETMELSE